MSLRSKLEPLLQGSLKSTVAQHQLNSLVNEAVSTRDGKGLFLLALARHAYMQALDILENNGKSIFEEKAFKVCSIIVLKKI